MCDMDNSGFEPLTSKYKYHAETICHLYIESYIDIKIYA